MLNFEKLNKIGGFDKKNLKNAKQNNYAWSMADFGDYIYVGTGRNIPEYAANLIQINIELPLLIRTTETDNNGEIWRYKKDGTGKWEKVFRADDADNIMGFRFMTVHASKNSAPALYAASTSPDNTGVFIFKTTDGSNWDKVGGVLKGNSSRAMASFNGKLYVATLDSSPDNKQKFLLYESEDPEFYDFKLSVDFNNPGFLAEKNPTTPIANMDVFNNKLYVCTGGEEGFEVWRTNDDSVKMNEWTLVGDKGFGDAMNQTSIGIGVYKDHLYIAAIKKFPLIILLPLGAEIIRIDKNDSWELIVGGEPIEKTEPVTGERGKALSGYSGGFSNPFNVYIWQLTQYRGNLIASTFDNGSNIEALRDIVLLNKEMITNIIGEDLYKLVIKLYDTVLYLFDKFNYPRGFAMYSSVDGIHFTPITVNGLGNGNNYGARMLIVDSENNLYVGTANPYDGCDVYRSKRYDPRTQIGRSLGNLADVSKIMDEVEEMYNEILNKIRD